MKRLSFLLIFALLCAFSSRAQRQSEVPLAEQQQVRLKGNIVPEAIKQRSFRLQNRFVALVTNSLFIYIL